MKYSGYIFILIFTIFANCTYPENDLKIIDSCYMALGYKDSPKEIILNFPFEAFDLEYWAMCGEPCERFGNDELKVKVCHYYKIQNDTIINKDPILTLEEIELGVIKFLKMEIIDTRKKYSIDMNFEKDLPIEIVQDNNIIKYQYGYVLEYEQFSVYKYFYSFISNLEFISIEFSSEFLTEDEHQIKTQIDFIIENIKM